MTAEYINEDGYLFITVAAPWTIESAKQVIDKAKTEATKHESRRILFDLTQWAKPDSEMVRFYSGEYLAKVFSYKFKVAAYALPGRINKLGENTAVNRGVVFRVFSDKAQAIAWLMKGANKPDVNDAS